jgi:hypothetical protein
MPSHRPADSISIVLPLLPLPLLSLPPTATDDEDDDDRGIVPMGITSHASLVATSLTSSIIHPVIAALRRISCAALAAKDGS